MRSFLASDEENESRFLWDSLFTLILLGVCVALLVADVRQHPVAGQARSTLLRYSVPVLQAIALPIEGIAFSTQQLNNLVHLRRENDALRAEVERLRNWFFVAQNLAIENTELRDMLRYTANPELDFISAKVLSKTSGAFSESLLFSFGADQKITLNMIAMVDNAVVGRVVRVGDGDATVLLLSDVRSRVPVVLQKNRERAIVAGMNSSTELELRYLRPNAKVEAGEIVVTSGAGGIFPAGLPVGTIKLQGNDTVTVLPLADLNRIDFVRLTNPTAQTPVLAGQNP